MRNLEYIQSVVDYIEDNMQHKLDLDSVCSACGYSKYHLSRMFSACVGFSLHEYIRRRRLTEAARLLAQTNQTIMDIALHTGYSNQQSFTVSFADAFGCPPARYRLNGQFTPYQLKIRVALPDKLKGDMIMNIRMEKERRMKLVGFSGNTEEGFPVIGRCWEQLHGRKAEIAGRTDMNFLVGLNDYSTWNVREDKQPSFVYFACAEVQDFSQTPEGMVEKELPVSDYVVFTYSGKAEDSMEPVVDYIYKEWFPQSTCILNEDAKYDFARYGESMDETGKSIIEYWVPVL